MQTQLLEYKDTRQSVDYYSDQFQTPPHIAEYMVSMLPENVYTVLEPTPGQGNCVTALERQNYRVIAPQEYFQWIKKPVDAVVMNPPFTTKVLNLTFSNLTESYFKRLPVPDYFIRDLLPITESMIALIPWYSIINSVKRTERLKRYGFKSITNLPRDTFKGTRVQVCILELVKGYSGITEFKNYIKG